MAPSLSRLPAGGLTARLHRAWIFSRMYRLNLWRDGETRSGPGSRRDSPSVRVSMDALTELVARHGIASLNDIPCGDFNWMGAWLERHPAVRYRGFDIVPAMIRRNGGRHPGRAFAVLDIVAEVPPPADLIFCKDLMNHLRAAEIESAVANMRASGSTYLLASNNFGYRYEEIRNGFGHCGSRHIDLTAAPFHYPPPLWRTHYLGLWRLADMAR